MRKHYLILVLFFLVVAMLKADAHGKENPLSCGNNKSEMTPCDPPIVNADTLLLQYLTNEPLTAVGGVPPYTYTFSPAISTSSLVALLTSTVTTVYTITVTGANGCDSVYHATYVPLPGGTGGACTTPFLSEYIQDTVPNPSGDGINDAIELYNPTYGTINLNGYYLIGTTNGSLYATPFFIALHGTIAAHKTFLIANTNADTALTHKAGMLSDSLSFRGKDIVALAKISLTPTVTFSFLDEVGAITPLPTDSGWAVGSGSTKNHTLVRQTSVTEGTMNWGVSQSEWDVYPRGTYTYIGHYSNICTPTDPDINLYIRNIQTICDTPSYVTFNIMAASNPSTILNNCVIDISYFGGEFAGDSVVNGGIIVTRGPDFQPGAGNDYDVFDSADVSPGIAKIIIGDVSDSSPNGTYLTATEDTLFIVSLRIQNSCQTGYVKFTNLFNTDTAYYAVIDSQQVTVPDSAYEQICTNCALPCDSCNYDGTCGCYLSYCCSDSSAWVITGDSTYYAYFSNGNSHYTTIIYAADSFSSPGCPLTLLSFNDRIEAGTNHYSVAPIPAIHNNSSILYIKGMGFGNRKDSIQVSNANNYGMVSLDSSDILLWTENLIKVKMPSVLFNNPYATPGTGPIAVYNACGAATSGNILQINYNIKNVSAGQQKLRPNILMQSISSIHSLIFRCDTSITHNAAAYACIKKAVKEWNCWTGVSWIVGDSIRLDTTLADSISNIYFSNWNFTPTGHLMQTLQQILPCYLDSVAFYNEADIEIRRGKFLSKKWSYDTTYTQRAPDSSYFYDLILHELGHAHGLGHINDSLSLMYRYEPSGQRDSIPSQGARWPGPATLLGGIDMVNTSSALLPSDFRCDSYINLHSGVTDCRDAKLNMPVVSKNSYNLNLFPNPINYGNLTIAYDLTENSTVQFRILDCTGRPVITLPEEHKTPGNYNELISINNLAQGVYLFVANINGEIQVIKFVKL